MTVEEQRERDARIADEVARKWRDHERVYQNGVNEFAATKEWRLVGEAFRGATDCASCAEVAEEIARRIRSGQDH